MKKTILPVIIALLAASVITAGGIISASNSPTKAETPFVSEITDRVNIGIDSTSFTYGKAAQGGYEFSFILSLSKAEPDFFAKTESFDIEGTAYSSIVFEALGDTPDGSITDGLVLSAKDGKSIEYRWRVTVYTDSKPKSATAVLRMTSGITELTSETWVKEIPLTFK